MSQTNMVVVGGGAAGFFAAIACAESNPNAHVTILERNANVLNKVRISGGGRCNVTHACFDPVQMIANYPRGSKALLGPLTRFGSRETVAWFESHGVRLKTESDGRMFPTTDDSSTIVSCLIYAARDAGVAIRTKVEITRVAAVGPFFRPLNPDQATCNEIEITESHTAQFEVGLSDGESFECDRLVLATGSSPQGWCWAQTFGHTIASPVPSLFTLEIRDSRLADLAGVAVERAQVRLASSGLTQIGPLLITHWGLSGPAVLKLSAWGARVLHECNYRTELEVNWLPDVREDEVLQLLHELKRERGSQLVSAHSPFSTIPVRLWKKLTAAADILDAQRWAKIPKTNLMRLTDELHRGRYYIVGKGHFKEEFVTCGGVVLDEVNFRTMESRVYPGLHFAGEILDIDGVTGGFNFQSAWTTGWIAGNTR